MELNLVLNHIKSKSKELTSRLDQRFHQKQKKGIKIEIEGSFGINNSTSLVQTCVLFSLVACVLDFKNVYRKGKLNKNSSIGSIKMIC